MGRRKLKETGNSTGATRVGWHLLVIDEGPIRRAALEEYRAAERELGKLRGVMEVFETRDLPGYHEWEARTFGALLSEIREMEAGIEEKGRLLDWIEDEMRWERCSAVTAYRRAMAERNRSPEERAAADAEEAEDFHEGPDSEMDGDGPFDLEAFEKLSKREQAAARKRYEGIAEVFRMMTGENPPSWEEMLAGERARRERMASPNRAGGELPTDQRLKTLYRRLVRRLHPDGRGELTARERELWHEVQAAYQARDLERMEAVAGRVEMGLNGDAAALPVLTLRRMAGDLARSLRELKRVVARARRQPAWSFGRLSKKRDRIEVARRRELERARAEARRDLARLTGILDDLAAKAERAKKPSRRGQRGGRPEEQGTLF